MGGSKVFPVGGYPTVTFPSHKATLELVDIP